MLRGCRQGNPIASALFLLCIEILCIKLRNSENVKGINIGNIEVLLSLYADDCSIFLNYDAQNLRNAIQILNNFQYYNTTNTSTIPNDYILCRDLGLKYDQQFNLLGITFDGTLSNMEINFDKKILEIRTAIKKWKYRFLTPTGRACVAKTLLLSKMSHIAFVIPSLNKHKLKSIENEIYQFMWKGSDKVKRKDAKQSEILGGLNVPDVISSWKSFKISWFRRLESRIKTHGNIYLLITC